MITGLLAFLATLLGVEEPAVQPPVRVMRVEESWIVRVPVRPQPALRLRWEEEKGPKCFPAPAIAAAMLSGPDSIDFVLRNRQRLRAQLDSDCDGLDFYGGFYVQSGDGQLCARRDEIRSRMGGSCRIRRLHSLVPHLER